MDYFDVEQYVLDNLDRAKRTTTGQIVAVCPWCGKYGSFYVHATEGHYVCFRCEEKGRYLVGVVSKIEDISWYQAKQFILKRLLKSKRKYNIENLYDKVFELKEEKKEKKKIKIDLPKEYIPIYKKNRQRKWKFPKYLKERGIEKETAKFWKLGYCLTGKYFNRIIIPIICDNGNSFTARATGKSERKYLNPKGIDHSKLIFGWNKLKIDSDIVLVEGPFDTIKMWQHGYQSLSLGGKVLHEEQLKLISKLKNDISITIMLDPEEKIAPYNVAEKLIFYFERIYISRLPEGIDPGSSTKKQADLAYNNSVLYTGDRLSKLRSKIIT